MRLTYKKKKTKDENKGTAEKVRREFVATDVSVDTDERTVTATITTSAVDRYGEVVISGGADLENYLKNPIVLWVHDSYNLPIGRAIWLKKTRNKIMAKIQFVAKEINEFAEQVYQMYKEGFLKAFSIGFRPDFKKMRPPTPEEIEKLPEWSAASKIYFKWELLEFSAVPIPANPQALAKAVKNHEIEASPKLLEHLGYEIEDDDNEEIHIAEQATMPETVTAGASADSTAVTVTTLAGTKDKLPLTVKSFFDAEQAIDSIRSFEVSSFGIINRNDLLADELNKHKGKVYD